MRRRPRPEQLAQFDAMPARQLEHWPGLVRVLVEDGCKTHGLQRTSLHLLALDRFEKSREVAFAEAVRVSSALDHFVKQRWAIENRLAEKLQQIAVRAIAVDENSQLL